jgi:acetylornithine deacetylase/succinyl-diaminopimelate desuccinylase-like protein
MRKPPIDELRGDPVANPKASLIDDDDVLSLATKICSLKTPPDERVVADLLADYLDRPGIDVHVMDLVPGRANIIATVRGSGERAPLVLNGHLDAGIHPGPWTRDPYQPWVDSGRLYGAGITDMNGAVAAMAAAIAAAPKLDALPGDLIFQGVMWHDTIGLGTKFAFAHEGPDEGFGICGEPSNLAIHTANAGAVKFEVQLFGKTAHISRMAEGKDAARAAIAVYEALRAVEFSYEPCDRLPDLPLLMFSHVGGSSDQATVPDRGLIRGDLRTVPGMTRQAVRAKLEEAVQAVCPEGVDWRVGLTAVQKPFLGVTEGPLVEAILNAHADAFGTATKVTSEMPGQSFVTDAADMAHAGLDTVVYGVGEWHHAPDQSVGIAEMANSARVYLSVAASPLA